MPQILNRLVDLTEGSPAGTLVDRQRVEPRRARVALARSPNTATPSAAFNNRGSARAALAMAIVVATSMKRRRSMVRFPSAVTEGQTELMAGRYGGISSR